MTLSFHLRKQLSFGLLGLLVPVCASALCLLDRPVCNGDKTFAFYDNTVHKGVVSIPGPEVPVAKFTADDGSLHDVPVADIAVTKDGECSVKDICVGSMVSHREHKKPVAGKVVGLFGNGFAAVDEGDKIVSYHMKSLTWMPNLADQERKKKEDQAALKEALSKFNDSCISLHKSLESPESACFSPEKNLTSEGTFASTMLNAAQAANLYADLGAPCAGFVRGIYQSGGTLASITVMNAAKPISDIPLPDGSKSSIFYHYTNAAAFLNLFHPEITDRKEAQRQAEKNGEYDKIFEFYKLRGPDPKGFWDRVHYLAEDPVSSQYAGGLRVSFKIDPKAKTVTWDDRMWAHALAELEKRYPGFAASCGSDLPLVHVDTYGSVRYNNVLFMIAEDSGIDMLDYNSRRWFMLVSPRSIRETVLESCNSSNAVPRGFQPERNPGQFVPTCTPYGK